jgi:Zeta toxin
LAVFRTKYWPCGASKKPDLTWDGTLKDTEWAAAMIDLAVKHEWEVEIAYIYRNLELALYGAVERRKKEGRAVPLDQLPATHRTAQQAVLNLSLLYSGRSKISFLFLHNLGKKGAFSDPLKIEIKELEVNGALHYLRRHEDYYSQAASHLEQDHQK